MADGKSLAKQINNVQSGMFVQLNNHIQAFLVPGHLRGVQEDSLVAFNIANYKHSFLSK